MHDNSIDEAEEIKPIDNLSTYLKQTFQIYGRGFWKNIVIVAITNAIIWGAYWLWAKSLFNSITDFSMTTVSLTATSIVIVIFSWILGVLMNGVLIRLTSTIYVDTENRIGFTIVASLKRLVPTIIASLILALIIIAVYFIVSLFMLVPFINIVALLVFIIVGTIIGVRLAFIFHAIFIEGAGPVKAFHRSAELVKDEWRHTFGYLLVIGIISIIISICIYFILFFNSYAGEIIATIFVTPIQIIGTTLLYWDLRARNERCRLEKITVELNT
ncbi:MAG TPA: hypothetical protein G4O15_06230 [Dehalococcoidia bacterium]|nr:hypothetical protein [Dehalococcoidia bacterium]